jgi:hypothetical protein
MTMSKDAAIRNTKARIARIHETIRDIEYLSSGTLLKRVKRCGNPRCACAKDPAARHGPYYEWSYMKDGRLNHRTLSPEQAKLWEAYTRRLIELTAPRRR